MKKKTLLIFALAFVLGSFGTAAKSALVLSNFHMSGMILIAGLSSDYEPFSRNGFGSIGQYIPEGKNYYTYSNPIGDGTYQRMTLYPNATFFPLATIGSSWSATVTFNWYGLPAASNGFSYFTLKTYDEYGIDSVNWYASRPSGSATIKMNTNPWGYTPYFSYTSYLQPVPEPSPILAFLIGTLGLAGFVLRQRKVKHILNLDFRANYRGCFIIKMSRHLK